MEVILWFILIVMILCIIGYAIQKRREYKYRLKKRLNDLLVIVLRDGFQSGICKAMQTQFLETESSNYKEEEYNQLKSYIKRQKPRWFINHKFYKNKAYEGQLYWWSCNEVGNKQRIEFLKHLIIKLS